MSGFASRRRETEQVATEKVAAEARLEALEVAIRDLEGRMLDALELRDRAAADRLDVLRERIEVLLAPAGPGAADPQPDPDAMELAFLAHLATLVSDRHALDIGAHRGRYAEALLDAGLEVVAAEPHPELAAGLQERLAGRAGATVRAVAVDEAPGRARLHLADDRSPATGGNDATLFSTLIARGRAGALGFRPGPEVDTTTIDELRRELGWPAEVGIVKIDVEGAEDRALAGMGETRPEVLMIEYWGADHMFALDDRDASDRVVPPALRGGELTQWIALIHDGHSVAFAVSPETVPASTWGNVVFFADDGLFGSAMDWCREHLAERTVQAGQPAGVSTVGPGAGAEPWRGSEYHEDCAALDRLRRRGWRPRCIFDVGASNGAWTTVVSALYPLAEYHLFEPLAANPGYEPALTWLSGRPDLNVTVHPVALDDTERTTTIGVSSDPVGSSILVDTVSDYFPSAVPVQTRTLDAYRAAHSLPAPQLLKLDTQGLELRILQGAQATLETVEVLLVETWIRRGYGAETPLLHELMAWLAERGFVVADFAGEYRDSADDLFSKDVLFARTDVIS
jgi:FkbM family methyltransferase